MLKIACIQNVYKFEINPYTKNCVYGNYKKRALEKVGTRLLPLPQ